MTDFAESGVIREPAADGRARSVATFDADQETLIGPLDGLACPLADGADAPAGTVDYREPPADVPPAPSAEGPPTDAAGLTSDDAPLEGIPADLVGRGLLPPGTKLRHFRLERVLGRGGMGAVYRAFDISLERPVALKVLRPDRTGSSRSDAAPPAVGSDPNVPPGEETDDAATVDFPGHAAAAAAGVTVEPGRGGERGPRPSIRRTGGGSAARSPGTVEQVLREARAQARMNHPNVVHIYYVSPDPERPFLAMELVEGRSLATRLREGPLDYAEVVEVGRQLTSALAAAARDGVTHGDVKPGNVLLAGPPDRPTAVVKLSDFGLSRRRGDARGTSVGGTPAYLAPEVVRGEPTGEKSDLYALGVTLYEMTFGRVPFAESGSSVRARLRAHLTAPIVFPDPWPAELPQGWRRVLRTLLQKDPARRHADHAALAADLDRLTPLSQPSAGLAVRLLAWGVDLVLVVTAAELVIAAVVLGEFTILNGWGAGAGEEVAWNSAALRPIASGLSFTAVSLAVCIPVLLLAYGQRRWSTTPGKTLFQTRIVDRHGLRPTRRTLFTRGLVQTFPVWGLTLIGMFHEVVGWGAAERVGLLAVALATLCDGSLAVLRRDRRTLHDEAFGTRVVLHGG